MADIVKFKRKVRPLRKTYLPTAPYAVEREDQDSGAITYEVIDGRPESYRVVCHTDDDCGGNPYAKHDAEQIARGLNLLLQYGKEILPQVREEFSGRDMESDDD